MEASMGDHDDSIRRIQNILHTVGACHCKAKEMVDDENFSVTSGTFPEVVVHQPVRGRSRSPRPYTPNGLELEPSDIEEDPLIEQVQQPEVEQMSFLQSLFSCGGGAYL